MSEKKRERERKGKTYKVFFTVLLGREDCHKVLIGVPCSEILHDCLGVVLRGEYLVTRRVANRDSESAGRGCLEEVCDGVCGTDCRRWTCGGEAEVCYIHIVYETSDPIAFIYMLSYKDELANF